jgi:hypothetical protein
MRPRSASILGPALLSVLFLYCASLSAQEKAANQTLTDISILGGQSDAVVRIVNQGIMAPLSPGLFGPEDITTRRVFAVAMQRLFRLASARKEPLFEDVPPTDADFEAINSVAPFLERQAFCPGCALINDFRPDAPIAVTEEAVALTSVLNSRRQLELVKASDAPSILAPEPGLPRIAAPALVFLATAVHDGIVSADDLKARNAAPIATRAGTAILLDGVQQRFKIPSLPQP